ncbi:carboxylesterase/lipase family protein [Nocardia sp. CDC160]|uniref:carboxylesterase/lipase family protein n=1 Tax=Nocardia sp. CDC160 TaxID=3112166 RepID=UPI002DB5C57C|nr:carboxylesterase family protein [Nocardia sp. CDC160]MEC3918666.1 carboxylesterase family protein [Nocardia sp. CDC160]
MDVEPEIRTAAGVVRGSWESAVVVFRGIRYAEPPIGPRRFLAPIPVRPWDGVRDAREFGPPVPQSSNLGLVMSSVSGDVEDGSEDCLTLNVWSPDLGGANLPVMVWIQGGTYLENNTANPHCDGATLARAAVVVVSMNYRVGMDGFGRITGAPDNRGILDQIAALEWVQHNIAAFGGDPANVTVFGQSAGAASIAALLVMPKAAGLFRRAISQSMPGTYFTPRLADAISTTIAAQLGVRATVSDLARLPPRALTDATTAVIAKLPEFVDIWGPMALTPTPFSPIVDGDVLPCAPWTGVSNGAAHAVDLLIGHTRDEFRLYTSQPGNQPTPEQVAVAFDHLGPGTDGERAYRTAYPDATPSQRFEILNSDWLFRMPSLHLADAAYVGGGPVWFYELAWSFNAEQGASHCLDFLLLFGTLSPDEVRAHRSAHPTAADEIPHVAKRIRADWVSFATTGKPGWAPYDSRTRVTRVYDAEAVTRPYPEQASRRIWSAYRFGTLDLMG